MRVSRSTYLLLVVFVTLAVAALVGSFVGVGRPVFQPMASPGEVPPLGADQLGRSFARVLLVATARTLRVALLALVLGTVAGWTVGIASVLTRSLERVGNAFNLVLTSLPPIYVALLAASFAARIGSVELWLTLTLTLLEAQRAYRASARTAGTVIVQPYAFGARVLGAGGFYLARRYLFPEVRRQWLPIMPLELAELVALEATVSFLGLGGGTANPTLGRLIADGRHFVRTAPHLFWVAAGLLMAIVSVLIYGSFSSRGTVEIGTG